MVLNSHGLSIGDLQITKEYSDYSQEAQETVGQYSTAYVKKLVKNAKGTWKQICPTVSCVEVCNTELIGQFKPV